MRVNHKYGYLWAALLCVGLAGCDIETTGGDKPGPNKPGPGIDPNCPPGTWNYCPIVGDIGRIFIPEPYGLGMTWFAYQRANHTLGPIPGVYRVEKNGKTTLFRPTSWYSDRGDSGFFTLEGRAMDDPNATTQTLKFQANMKQGPVCLSLDDWAEVECEGPRSDLVFRIEYRQVATAGFAVSNPAIYTRYHFADAVDGELPITIWHTDITTVDAAADAIDDDNAWTRVEDATLVPSDAVLYTFLDPLKPGGSTPAFLQASAAMELIGWSVRKTDDPYQVEFTANCVPTLTEDAKNKQTLPLAKDAKTRLLSFAPDHTSLVVLCGEDGPEIISSQRDPMRGLWPDSDVYDLVVDSYTTDLQVRIAPGDFIWSSGQDEIDESVIIPGELWE